MSDLDRRALEANFQLWHNARAPDKDAPTAFERYTIEQVLKDADLSDDDIDAGHVGGSNDGGIDGFYCFVNGSLVRAEEGLPVDCRELELVVIQTKRSGGFSETAFDKIATFLRDTLDWETSIDDLRNHLNTSVRENIELFRTTFDAFLGQAAKFTISVFLVTGGEADYSSKLDTKLASLKDYIRSKVSYATPNIQFWDCRDLLRAVRATPQQSFSLDTVKLFHTEDARAVVCLVRVLELANFLTDENGNERRSLFESNVRAYQGPSIQVNKDIRETLEDDAQDKDFWWFNNGVTVLANEYQYAGAKLMLNRPQVVNGLQTCREIFEYVARSSPIDDQRAVLLRVIIPPDKETRDRIIKATNFQSRIPTISLRAHEPVHHDIEDKLRLFDLFYDRRKGEYREKRKPIARIVSMKEMGKAVMAIFLQQPNDARARPGTVLNRDDDYSRIFNRDYDSDLYSSCIRIDRRIVEYLRSKTELGRDVRTDIRHYVEMVAVCDLADNPEPTIEQIVELGRNISSELTDDIIGRAVRDVKTLYEELGGTDKVAKGTKLIARLKGRLNAQ